MTKFNFTIKPFYLMGNVLFMLLLKIYIFKRKQIKKKKTIYENIAFILLLNNKNY